MDNLERVVAAQISKVVSARKTFRPISFLWRCRIPNSFFEEGDDQFIDEGRLIAETSIYECSFHNKMDLSSEPSDATAIQFTKSLEGISSAKEFLVIECGAEKFILTPRSYWIVLDDQVLHGNTLSINVTEFSYEIKVDAPRDDDDIIDKTWLYTTKRGDQDRRYANNRQLWLVRRFGVTIAVDKIEIEVYLFSENDCNSFSKSLCIMIKYEARLNDGENQQYAEDESDYKEPDCREWYEVLEVSPDADLQEKRSAYLKLIKQYHPDLVANLGVKLREVAEQETKAINEAYQLAVGKKRR
jgi:hypothetical protein